MNRTVEITCAECGNLTEVIKYNAKRGQKFCSLRCFGLARWRGRRIDPVERFWSKIDKTPGHGPNGDCWIYTGAINSVGYGHFWFESKHALAHVFSYELANGKIDRSVPRRKRFVRHSCDVRACCNPEHLLLGTASENMKDCIERGRRGIGGHKKLNATEVLEIRSSTLSNRKCASLYGVDEACVRAVRARRTWKHLT